MARKKKQSQPGKKFKTFLIILIVIAVLAIVSIKFLLEPYLKVKITSELNKNPKRLYEILFDDIDLNLFYGSAKIDNLSITPRDTATLLLENSAIRGLVSAHTELLHIIEFNILEFLKTKSMIINGIKVENIAINYLSNPQAKPADRNTSGNLVDVFPAKINSIDINYFEILTASLTYTEIENPDEPLLLIDSLSVSIENIRVDSAILQQPAPLTFTNIELNSRYISYTPLKFYTISTAGIRFDVQDTSLTIKQFQLIPKYNKEEFNRQIKYNEDWFSISVDSIVLTGFNANELEGDNIIHINSIDIEKPDIEIYRDKRLPDAPFKHKVLITGGLSSVEQDFLIDTVNVKNGNLSYGEMTDAADKPGKVFFSPFSLIAINITNDSVTIENNPNLETDFSGIIMGKSALNAHLTFLLKSTNEYFTVAGTLDPIAAAEFNPMVEGLMTASITSGDVKVAKFNFNATEDVSDGELTLIYENLMVDVSKLNDPDKKSGFMSDIANLVVRNDNLPEDKKYTIGTIHFERRKDRFIVNYLWNSIKTGIISIVAPIADNNKKLDRQEKREQKKKDKQ